MHRPICVAVFIFAYNLETTKGKHFNVKTTCENEKPNVNASLEKYIFIKKKIFI